MRRFRWRLVTFGAFRRHFRCMLPRRHIGTPQAGGGLPYGPPHPRPSPETFDANPRNDRSLCAAAAEEGQRRPFRACGDSRRPTRRWRRGRLHGFPGAGAANRIGRRSRRPPTARRWELCGLRAACDSAAASRRSRSGARASSARDYVPQKRRAPTTGAACRRSSACAGRHASASNTHAATTAAAGCDRAQCVRTIDFQE